jgi:hypothetical protein
MELFVNILAAIFVLFGIFVVLAGGVGNFLGGGVAVIAGMYAYDTKSFIPLIIGFAAMWVLRLMGFDRGSR